MFCETLQICRLGTELFTKLAVQILGCIVGILVPSALSFLLNEVMVESAYFPQKGVPSLLITNHEVLSSSPEPRFHCWILLQIGDRFPFINTIGHG